MSDSIAADALRLFVERAERLIEERKGLAEDKKDVLLEAKANGYCVKTLRKIIALRKMDTAARQEAEAMLATYMNALGMQTGFDF